MKEYKHDDWYVFEERTMKPFEHFRADASKGAMEGLGGLFSSYTWSGREMLLSNPTCDSTVDYNEGVVRCRVKFKRLSPFLAIPVVSDWLQKKILSDVRGLTERVCGLHDTETKDVFIVHGHDKKPLAELKELLTKLQLRPVVLTEQNDRGMTIVDKFEYYGSACSFAFILMTPDDKSSGEDGSDEERWRARQNVILELGWFRARLGRDRVAILYKGDEELEIPSDMLGVSYLRFKENISECADGIFQRLQGMGLTDATR